jgi:hypothetical protein
MKTKTKLAQAKSKRPHLGEPKVTVPPNPKKVLWCPFCDWRHSDSFTGRRRLGNHCADAHYKDVAFNQGEEPPDLDD